MLEKDLGHLCCSSFLHGGIFVSKSPCRLLAGAATLLSRLAEHRHVFALAFWWQIPAPLHYTKDAHHPLGLDVTCPKGRERLLSYSNSSGRGDWGWCLAEGAPCSVIWCSPHPSLVLVAQACHLCHTGRAGTLSQSGSSCSVRPFRHLQFPFITVKSQ